MTAEAKIRDLLEGPAGRLTMGLRRIDGRRVVEHGLHFFPVPIGQAG